MRDGIRIKAQRAGRCAKRGAKVALSLGKVQVSDASHPVTVTRAIGIDRFQAGAPRRPLLAFLAGHCG